MRTSELIFSGSYVFGIVWYILIFLFVVVVRALPEKLQICCGIRGIIIVAAIGLVILVTASSAYSDTESYRKEGTEVNALITDIDKSVSRTRRSGHKTTYTIKVQYEVDGKLQEATLGSTNLKPSKGDGEYLLVYYMNEKPTQVIAIDEEIRYIKKMVMTSIGILFLIIIIFLWRMYPAWVPSWQTDSQNIYSKNTYTILNDDLDAFLEISKETEKEAVDNGNIETLKMPSQKTEFELYTEEEYKKRKKER